MKTHPLRGLLWQGTLVLLGIAAFYAAYGLLGAHTHWAVAFTVVLATAFLGWFFACWAVLHLSRQWKYGGIDDYYIRRVLKLTSDEGLKSEEQGYLLLRTQHTPAFGKETCPECGTLAPTRCYPYIEAERHLYALRTEIRLRSEQRKLAERDQPPNTPSQPSEGDRP